MGFRPLTSVLSVALLNSSTVIGLIITGLLIDVMHVSNVLLITAVISTATVFLLWGFATTEPVLYAFCILFGVTAGGYTATWTGAAKEVKSAHEHKLRLEGKSEEDEGAVEVAVVMGVMAAGRGFGCFASGPVSEALMKLPKPHGKGVWSTNYAWLVIFVGLTMLLGRFGSFGRSGLRFSDRGKKGKERQTEDWATEESERLIK